MKKPKVIISSCFFVWKTERIHIRVLGGIRMLEPQVTTS